MTIDEISPDLRHPPNPVRERDVVAVCDDDELALRELHPAIEVPDTEILRIPLQ
jgi:hypothetical protein